MIKDSNQNSEIIIYQPDTGVPRVEVQLEGGLESDSVVKKIFTTTTAGKDYKTMTKIRKEAQKI